VREDLSERSAPRWTDFFACQISMLSIEFLCTCGRLEKMTSIAESTERRATSMKQAMENAQTQVTRRHSHAQTVLHDSTSPAHHSLHRCIARSTPESCPASCNPPSTGRGQAAQLQREVEGLTTERIKQKAVLLELQHNLVHASGKERKRG
jgi:hypothetical protein